MRLIHKPYPRILILEAPPRHGKSEYVSRYLPSWFLGRFPNKHVILTSYEAKFARMWGRRSRDVLRENGQLFGVRVSGNQQAGAEWETDQGGGMVTAGVGGPITGRGADLLVVDDAIRNGKDAASQIVRDAQWEWWQSTASIRLEPHGIAIVMMTRWHEDDLIGRLLNAAADGSGEPVRRLRLPALAEEDDPLGRRLGEALWPERWPLRIMGDDGFVEGGLEHIRAGKTAYWWSAQYQQSPTPREGLFFKVHALKIDEAAPRSMTKIVRAWDLAASAATGDYTVGIKMGVRDGIYYVLDMVRGQWATDERNTTIIQTAETDGKECRIVGPQDPGSAGVDTAKAFTKMLAGFTVKTIKVSGSKETRADPYSAQVNAGNVKLVKGPWNKAFIEEHRTFPAGANDDAVDASADAFNDLTSKGKFVVGTG
jgi:predicted phage terminase large subunit-like protein